MARFESEAVAFHSLLQIMGQSIIKLLTKTGLAAFALVSAQAAGAITLTYTPTGATYVPIAPSNTRPLQFSASGNAITNPRNFIYLGLSSNNLVAGDWTPVGQLGSGSTGPLRAGEQRFDYRFPAASAQFTNPVNNLWLDNVETDFGSFFLAGSCNFCGVANSVQLLSTIDSNGDYIGVATADAITGSTGSQNYLNSKIYDIVFGASGIKGTINFDAFTTIIDASGTVPVQQTNGGKIVINVNQEPTPSLPVPGPLPLLGAGAAFGFSRRMRRQIQSKQS
jgi:hypothetical protein